MPPKISLIQNYEKDNCCAHKNQLFDKKKRTVKKKKRRNQYTGIHLNAGNMNMTGIDYLLVYTVIRENTVLPEARTFIENTTRKYRGNKNDV